jgi:hypothetical protein
MIDGALDSFDFDEIRADAHDHFNGSVVGTSRFQIPDSRFQMRTTRILDSGC